MKYIYEFIGTFFLVLTVGMTVLNPNAAGAMAPLAIGAVLLAFVFAGGHLSQAHYNPAVSLAIYLRGKLSLKDMGLYWIFQLLAGVTAGFLTIYFKGKGAETTFQLDPFKAFLAELLFTFALCYVVLNVASNKETKNNSYFGLAIGFIVVAGAYAMGAVSSAAFNPAVALGITIMHFSSWSNLWIFIVANLLGGAIAAYVFEAAHPKKEKD
jgi:aquaporin Z